MKLLINQIVLAMKKYLLGFILSLCVHSPLWAVDNLRLLDMRSVGMGGNGVTQSVLLNPSLVALSHEKSIHIEYINRYLVKELGTIGITFQYPNTLLSTGVNISSFGYDKYRESLFRLFMGKQLNEKWTLGLAVEYTMLQTELFQGLSSRLSVDIGATFSPVDKLLVGMLIMNFPSVSVSKPDADIKDFIGYFLQIGFQWEVINHVLIVGSLGTDKENPVIGNLGMEYMAFDSFFFRAGMQTSPFLPSLGIGYGFSMFKIDVGGIYHPLLGVSTGVGISVTF